VLTAPAIDTMSTTADIGGLANSAANPPAPRMTAAASWIGATPRNTRRT